MKNLQKLVRPDRMPISPALPEWTLADMAQDHALLDLELKNLDFWQATILKNLLVAQAVVIKGRIVEFGDRRGPEWVQKASLAKHCKEMSIRAVLAHMADLRRAKVDDQPDSMASRKALTDQVASLESKLKRSRTHAARREQEIKIYKEVLRERLQPNFVQELFEEINRRQAASEASDVG